MDKKIPEIFWQKYIKILSKKEFERFQSSCLTSLRKSIRVNTLKTSVNDFKKKSKNLGWELSPIPWCKEGFWIDREDRSKPLGKSYLHQAGHFYIQEASSMLPPEVLNPKKNEIILDMASAPGSKTIQISAIMKNTGIIIANEPESSRIKAMASNIDRLGAANVLITKKHGQVFSEYFPNFFDKVLLDAPCSGEGTIRKDSKALETWNDKRVESIANIQRVLISHAFKTLKPGGELVYSTCTLSPEENEDIIKNLLEEFPNNAEVIPLNYPPANSSLEKLPDFGLKGVLRIWPHLYDSEGFFVAKIKKRHLTEAGNFIDTRRDSPFSKLSKKNKNFLNKYFLESFGFILKEDQNFFERGGQTFIRPENFESIASKIIIEKGGILFCERHKNDLKLTHEGALYLTQNYDIKKGFIDLNEDECKDYMEGRDINREIAEKNTVFIKFNNVFLGIGKKVQKKIKNQLPRHFVIQ